MFVKDDDVFGAITLCNWNKSNDYRVLEKLEIREDVVVFSETSQESFAVRITGCMHETRLCFFLNTKQNFEKNFR